MHSLSLTQALHCPAGSLADHLLGYARRQAIGCHAPGGALDHHRFDRAKHLHGLSTHALVSADQQHRCVEVPADRRVQPGLAHQQVIQPQVQDAFARPGVIQDGVLRAGAGVVADE